MNVLCSSALGFIIIPVLQALGCQQINVSCSDIKTPIGFNFKHGSSPAGSEIYVFDNRTCTAHALLGNPPTLTLSPEVLRVDNGSVTTRSCRNITVQLIVPHGLNKGKRLVKETCVHFQAQTDTDPPEAPLTLSSIVGVVVAAAVIAGAVALACWCLKSRNTCLNGPRKKEHLKRPPGSDAGTELHDAPGSVHVHSTEAAAGTPQPTGLGCSLSSETIQTTTDGDVGAHSADRIAHHRSMNRNLRKDPGGVNSNKAPDTIELDTGDAAGNHAEAHETEGQPLLSNQRAASFQMTGEATPLVNKASFDQDPVSRCCAALETDVESKNNVK